MIYPLVRDLAAADAPIRVPVAVTCRVPGFSRQVAGRRTIPWRCCRRRRRPVPSTVAAGGDCLSGTAVLRDQPDLAGPAASAATMWRLIDQLAHVPRMVRAVRSAVRQRVRQIAGAASPVKVGGEITIDLGATIVLAHSDKQSAAPTWKRTYGFHPLLAFVDHGPDGTGEPVAALLRPGNAGSNTAADHIQVTRNALAHVPRRHRRGRASLIRTDSAGGTHEFLAWLTRWGRWLSYSVGMTITPDIHTAILRIPRDAWSPAYDADGVQCDGAWVAEVTETLDLTGWPPGMRLIVRKELPHPGANYASPTSTATASPAPVATAGRIVHTGRRLLLRLPDHWPWNRMLRCALARLDDLPAPS